MAGTIVLATELSTRMVSAAPQMPVRRIFALTAISTAFAGSAATSTNRWQMPSRCAKTGTRASFCTRATSDLPPRGIMTSISPFAASMAPTAPRSDVGTICTPPRGSPAASSPLPTSSARKADVALLSDPPRRITALPAIRHRPAASTVTLGRDS